MCIYAERIISKDSKYRYVQNVEKKTEEPPIILT